eukprot:12111921-Prorocentrum_lima.AAC.1
MNVGVGNPHLPVAGGSCGGGHGGGGTPSSDHNSHAREYPSGSPRFPKGGKGPPDDTDGEDPDDDGDNNGGRPRRGRYYPDGGDPG